MGEDFLNSVLLIFLFCTYPQAKAIARNKEDIILTIDMKNDIIDFDKEELA